MKKKKENNRKTKSNKNPHLHKCHDSNSLVTNRNWSDRARKEMCCSCWIRENMLNKNVKFDAKAFIFWTKKIHPFHSDKIGKMALQSPYQSILAHTHTHTYTFIYSNIHEWRNNATSTVNILSKSWPCLAYNLEKWDEKKSHWL